MKEVLPKLTAHLEEFNFDVHFLMMKWLIYYFVNHLPLDAELAVWDLFMIKGISVVFRVAITLFQLMQDKILAAKNDGDIMIIVTEYQRKINRDTLLDRLFVGIKNQDIFKHRDMFKS